MSEKIKFKALQKVLIANRGEIAVRIIRACRALGLETVAVFSEVDRDALAVQMADEAVYIGPASSRESYLNFEALLDAAARTQSDAIHPGYGFLSENADFATRCLAAGLIFIGPQPEVIRQMGSKIEARELVASLGLPVIPGYHPYQGGGKQDLASLQERADALGYPLLLKAAAGGGGRGMRLLQSRADLAEVLESAQREALHAFGDDSLYLERYLKRVKHIEFQILGDQYGHLIHCFERECSIQRRHQKIIEESPAPILTPELRARMGAAAVRIGQALHYVGAGTVEFVLDSETDDFYFLEVNTRLQVEHPVTEWVTGLDLVQWQIAIAQGEALPLQQGDIRSQGHALECRLYAEDPQRDFQPAAGQVLCWQPAQGEGVRIDAGIQTGSQVGIDYDPMLAKFITYGSSRHLAVQRMRKALSNTVLLGLESNLEYLQQILVQPDFLAGDFDTHFVAQHELTPGRLSEACEHHLLIAALLWDWWQRQQQQPQLRSLPSGWRNSPYQHQFCELELDGRRFLLSYDCLEDQTFAVQIESDSYAVLLSEVTETALCCEVNGLRRRFEIRPQVGQAVGKSAQFWLHTPVLGVHQVRLLPRFPEAEAENEHGGYLANMPAKVVAVLVQPGQAVSAGQALLVLESMKMETTLTAAEDGVVQEIGVEAGDVVEAGTRLLLLSASEDA